MDIGELVGLLVVGFYLIASCKQLYDKLKDDSETKSRTYYKSDLRDVASLTFFVIAMGYCAFMLLKKLF